MKIWVEMGSDKINELEVGDLIINKFKIVDSFKENLPVYIEHEKGLCFRRVENQHVNMKQIRRKLVDKLHKLANHIEGYDR